MKNSIVATLFAAGALAATPALAQEMTPEPPMAEAPAAEQAPPATIDTNGDGVADAWDRNGDGVADAWDTTGDGQPDKIEPMAEEAAEEAAEQSLTGRTRRGREVQASGPFSLPVFIAGDWP